MKIRDSQSIDLDSRSVTITVSGIVIEPFKLDAREQSMNCGRLTHKPIFVFILTTLFLGTGIGFSQFFNPERAIKLNADWASLLDETDLEQLADNDSFSLVVQLFFPNLSFTGPNIRLGPASTRYHTESCHILSRPPPPFS